MRPHVLSSCAESAIKPQLTNISVWLCVQFVATLPKKLEDHTVVISCDEDIDQCRTAVDCGIPLVTSEFLLTGILQQKVDIDAYPLTPWFIFTQSRPINNQGQIQEFAKGGGGPFCSLPLLFVAPFPPLSSLPFF